MASLLVFASMSVITASSEVSCSSPGRQGGVSLLQSRRFTEPIKVGRESDTAPIHYDGEDTAQVQEAASAVAKENGHSRFSRLVKRLKSERVGFCRRHPCSLSHLDVGSKAHSLGRPGKMASLDESGYQAVAKLKDDYEMQIFIQRVIEEYDCRVKDDGGLMGIVPWFSGTVAEQSFMKLEDELLFAVLADGEPWLEYKNTAGISGESAPLDFQGYVEIACMRSDEAMMKFVRRLCMDMKIRITDEGGLQGVIALYSGSSSFQSFEKLKSELLSAAASPQSWAEFEN